MFIKKITLQNFKKFENLELSLKNRNEIYGKNGEGKSTIKDAIIFCFYGRTPNGNLAESTKFIKDGTTKCSVEIEFERDEQAYTVRRERTESQTRITYIDGSQSDEDSVITQRELDSIVPDYDLFQIVFNIGYFMRLSDKEKRDFLLRLTKNIDKKEIYLKLGGTEEAIVKYGFKSNWGNIEGIYKKLLKLNHDNNDNLTKINAIINDSKAIEITEITETDHSEELEKIKDEYTEFIELSHQWSVYGQRIDGVKKQQEINKQLAERMNAIVSDPCNKPSDKKLNLLIQRKNEIKTTISIPEGKCPTCLQDIEDAHKDKVDEVNRIRTHNIATLSKAIQEETADYREKMDKYEAYILAISEKERIKEKIVSIPEPKKPQKEITVFDEEKQKNLKEKQQEFIRQNTEQELLKRQEEERFKKIEELKNKRTLIEDEINEVSKILPIFSPKGIAAEEMRIKLDPIILEIQKMVPTARIETLEWLKNGLDQREVFSLFVNDIEYSKCSTGEKMKVDIALSQVIDEMAGNRIGVYFCDNSESIDNLPDIKEQSFIARVNQDKLIIK